jgi:aminoglycoside N3'-acetyltransferase
LAEDLVKDHHLSNTPFGKRTPYAKLIENRGKVVLLNVNANSLLHHLQEIVEWPGLFVEHEFCLAVAVDGSLVDVTTKVHAPGSGYIHFPGSEPGTTVKIHFPDYALPFCLNEKARKDFQKIDKKIKLALDDRQRFFLESGIVKMGAVGYGQAAVIKAFDFSKRVCQDLKSYLDKYPNPHG